jgi:anaerobic ribonucleoside-triphosphate reductase
MIKDTETISKEIAELRLQRDKLRARLESIQQDYKKGLSADSDDQAIELENADVLEGIAKAAAEELSQVEEKLSRLTKAQAI